MRKIAATYIFTLTQPPIKHGILVCENDGTIIEVQDKSDRFREEAGVEFYSGILVPGFVHIHANLQHHNKIENRKMWAAGIVLAADLNYDSLVVTSQNYCEMQSLNKRINIDTSFRNQFVNNQMIEGLFLHQEKNKELNLTEILLLVCLSGAKELGLSTKYGSFEKGKTPGVNLISCVDFQQMKLSSSSTVKRLL